MLPGNPSIEFAEKFVQNRRKTRKWRKGASSRERVSRYHRDRLKTAVRNVPIYFYGRYKMRKTNKNKIISQTLTFPI